MCSADIPYMNLAGEDLQPDRQGAAIIMLYITGITILTILMLFIIITDFADDKKMSGFEKKTVQLQRCGSNQIIFLVKNFEILQLNL